MRLRSRDSDQRLVHRVRRGDDDAFERLYSRYQPRIEAFCRHLTGNREDAEDAAQYTFLAAYRAIAESDQRLDVRPWLFTVARNRCLSLLRARRSHPDDALEPAVDSVLEQVEQRQALRDLVRDLGGLPEEQRAALLLSELGALSHGDVATVLDVPPAKVKALVFQARSSLIATREARDASCEDIRRQLATLSGSSLRRRMLRRHVGECPACQEFEAAVAEQRRTIAALVPPAIAVGGRGAVGALTAAGSGAGGLSAGGLFGSGVAGGLLGVGTQGAVSVALAAVMVGGGAAGVVATDLPARIGIGGDGSRAVAVGHGGTGRGEAAPLGSGAPTRGGDPEPPGRSVSDPSAGATTPGGGPAERPEAPEARPAEAGASGGVPGAAGTGGTGGTSGTGGGGQGASDPARAGDPPPGQEALPPGLARRDELPPGLARRDELPPGLAKRLDGGQPGAQGKGRAGGDVPPGREKRAVHGGNGNGNPAHGNGNGTAQGGNGNGDPQGGNGGSQGGSGNGNPQGGNGNGNPHGESGSQGGSGYGNPQGGNGNGNAQGGNGNGNAQGGNGNPQGSNGNAQGGNGNGNAQGANGNPQGGNGNGNG